MSVQTEATTCAVCGYVEAYGGLPFRTEADEGCCSYRCRALDAAKNAEGVEATMRAVAEAMGEGCTVRVRFQRGNSEWMRGEVVDWSVDGRQLAVCSERSGRDVNLRVGRIRSLVVL